MSFLPFYFLLKLALKHFEFLSTLYPFHQILNCVYHFFIKGCIEILLHLWWIAIKRFSSHLSYYYNINIVSNKTNNGSCFHISISKTYTKLCLVIKKKWRKNNLMKFKVSKWGRYPLQYCFRSLVSLYYTFV